jgi:hypothetical protein
VVCDGWEKLIIIVDLHDVAKVYVGVRSLGTENLNFLYVGVVPQRIFLSTRLWVSTISRVARVQNYRSLIHILMM